MRFPTASWPQVRKEVGRQLSDVPGARPQAAAALALLTAGAGSNVAIPILLGKIVDAVIDHGDIVPIGISLGWWLWSPHCFPLRGSMSFRA